MLEFSFFKSINSDCGIFPYIQVEQIYTDYMIISLGINILHGTASRMLHIEWFKKKDILYFVIIKTTFVKINGKFYVNSFC